MTSDVEHSHFIKVSLISFTAENPKIVHWQTRDSGASNDHVLTVPVDF